MVCFTSASVDVLLIAVDGLRTKCPFSTCIMSGFGMMEMESPAFAWKAVAEKRAIKQTKRNERLAKNVFLRKFFFIKMDFMVVKI